MSRVKKWRARFSLGAERKSAWLCQLHNGPAFFAPAFGGVQEAGFCVRLARGSECIASQLQLLCLQFGQLTCSLCCESWPRVWPRPNSIGSPSRIVPGRAPGRSMLAACASGRGEEWQRRRRAPTESAPRHGFSVVDGTRHPGVALGITGTTVPAWPFGAGWDACAGGRQDRWLNR